MTRSYMIKANEEQWKEICAELGATEESLKRDVNHLKDWLEKQPHLPNVTDDDFLTSFLIRCKNSVEKTKKYLNTFYVTRALMSDIIQHRDPASEIVQKHSNIISLFPLPKLTSEGYRIWIYNMSPELKNYTPSGDTILYVTTMLMDYSIKNDRNRSVIYIYNAENVTMPFVAQLFTIMKKFVTYGTRTCPARLHKVYIVNLVPTLESVLTTAKSVMKKKLTERIVIWKKKPEDLCEVLPKDVLPSDYGGYEKSIQELKHSFNEHLKEFHDWFETENKLMADLSKRPKDDPSNDYVAEYGMEGSFRKISID